MCASCWRFSLNKMKLIISIVVLNIFVGIVSSSFCYWNAGCPYRYFSTKTPYKNVRGDIRDAIIKLQGCEPVSVWSLISDGNRNPGAAFAASLDKAMDIRQHVLSSYENGDSSLCAQDVQYLEEWSIDKKILAEPNSLTEEGKEDFIGYGQRLKKAFSNLLNNLEEGEYELRPAAGDRIEDNVKAFIKGLRNEKLKIEKSKSGFDEIASYATCKNFQKDVEQNPKSVEEINKYHKTPEYLAAKDRIQRRLGIKEDLSNELLFVLYDLCRYIKIGSQFSPWCTIFTSDDLKSFEYIEDLKHYYKYGYGSPMSTQLGDFPLSELLKNFQQVKEGKGKKLVAYFSNAIMTDMACTALNLYKDETPLSAAKRDPNRNWRATVLASFSSNLLAVLNKCDKDGQVDYNVVFYFNEEPLRSICEFGVCTWQEFEDKLKPSLNATTHFCDA